jgi:hypothetical protein
MADQPDLPFRPEVMARMIADPAARWSDFGDPNFHEILTVEDTEAWSRLLFGMRFSKVWALMNAVRELSPYIRGDQSLEAAMKKAPRSVVAKVLADLRFGGWSDDELPPDL